MSSEREFAGQVAIVTGASSGIGKATAQLLAERGAIVALVARDASRLGELEAEIIAAGGQAFALPTDVTDAGARAQLIDAVRQRAGRLDVLVNAAGVIASGRIDDTDLRTKRAFTAIMFFFTLMETGAKEELPLITIPAQ